MSPRRVLAVASGGGHWVQLTRLAPAFDGHDVRFVSTLAGLNPPVEGTAVTRVKDASRSDKLGLVLLLLQITWIVLRFRPHVIVTTGAAPGLLALRLGKMIGARTAWIDSIANADELSLSGKLAERWADMWATQWPDLVSRYPRLSYFGEVV